MNKKPEIGPIIEPFEKRQRQAKVFFIFTEQFKDNKWKISQIAKKNSNFLEDFFEKDSTQKYILKLREKFGIPAEGFELNVKDIQALLNSPFFIPPTIKSNFPLAQKTIILGLRKLEEKVMIMNFEAMSVILRTFLFYNAYDYIFAAYLISSWNLCKIVNLEDEWNDYQPGNEKTNQSFLEHFKNEKKYYPINIRLSPYAGRRETINYIESSWSKIKEEQRKLAGKINPFISHRTIRSNFKDRNRLIYENRHLPEMDIYVLLSSYYKNCPHQGEIGSIISKEIKKRKD